MFAISCKGFLIENLYISNITGEFIFLSLPFLDCKNNSSDIREKIKKINPSLGSVEKIYCDPVNQRKLLRLDLAGKSGIYIWVNKLSNNMYVGSGNNLYKRLSNYYQPWYFKVRMEMLIHKALVKYGMVNFILVIVEFSDKDNLLKCEQKWMDELKPKYNINPLAGNSRGYKHSDRTKKILRAMGLNRVVSEETRKKMSEVHIGQEPTTGIKVEVTDIKTNITTIYESIVKAAKGLGVNVKTLWDYEQKLKQMELEPKNLYKNKWLINFLREDSNLSSRGKGVVVEVTDITSNVTTVFTSIKQAANGIGVNEKTIANFEKKLNKEKQQETNNNLYRNQFTIKFIRNNNNNAPSNK